MDFSAYTQKIIERQQTCIAQQLNHEFNINNNIKRDNNPTFTNTGNIKTHDKLKIRTNNANNEISSVSGFLGLSIKTWGYVGLIFLGIVVVGGILLYRFLNRNNNQEKTIDVKFEEVED